MYRIGTLAGIIATLLVSEASANFSVSCKNAKGPANSTTVNYEIKATESNRLNSDILISLNGGFNIYSTARVAQYLTKGNILYFMVDDNAENRILEFKAHPRYHHFKQRPYRHWNQKFEGFLQETTNNNLLKSIKLVCTITAV